MKYKAEVEMKLPSFNEYINLCRANKFMAAKYKSKIEKEIGYYLLKLPKFKKPIKINFTWVEGNKKRDLDNVCFAKKFILDAMVKLGKITDDNSKYVYAFTDTFEYADKSKVILEIKELGDEEKIL